MVDPLGTKPIKSNEPALAPVTRVAASVATPPVPERAPPTVASSLVATTAREFAAKPPIDHERVDRIRKAIAAGTFPIVPAQIADRLIAAKLDWARNDPE